MKKSVQLGVLDTPSYASRKVQSMSKKNLDRNKPLVTFWACTLVRSNHAKLKL